MGKRHLARNPPNLILVNLDVTLIKKSYLDMSKRHELIEEQYQKIIDFCCDVDFILAN